VAALVEDRIYQAQVPDDVVPVLPYIVLGAPFVGDFARFGGAPRDSALVLTVHLWAERGGYDQIANVYWACRDVLHGARLDVDDHFLADASFELTSAFPDADGQAIHGVATYRATSLAVA
jgi:hypothetical protein